MDKKILFILLAIIIVIAVSFIFIKNRNNQNERLDALYAGPQGDLSKVKTAILYEKVTDREFINGRNLEDTIKAIKDANPDMVFRGFWLWSDPVVESSNKIPPEVATLAAKKFNIKQEQVPELIKRSGYSYEELGRSVLSIKEEMPGVIFVGAIPAQMVGRIQIDPMTGNMLSTEDTWKMALDPQKWGINYTHNGKLLTKENLQELFATKNGKINLGKAYNWREAEGYTPDMTTPEFQNLFLGWAKKQIDEGSDAIWIDMLYNQGNALYGMTKDFNHPAVKESYDAASKMVDDIHKYGQSKGKYIYVGTWSEPISDYPGTLPKLDFVTDTPTPQEIYNGKFDEAQWNKLNNKIKNRFGNIPHFAFIDFGGKPDAPMDVFSQRLDKEKQKEFLKKADEFFTGKGMVFIYPVRGADFWGGAKVRAFGKLNKYDAFAPEFDTFNTIKELADKKKEK